MQPIIPITKERRFCVLYRFDIVSLSMVFSYVSETSNLIPQPGYTHGTAPVPTALPPAHPVSCAGRHTHERIIFCNRGVRIIHYLQTLLWQTVTSAPILHGQQGDYHHAGLSWHEMGSGHSAHTAKRKYIGMCACPIQFVKPLYNLFFKNQSPQFGYL